MIFHPFWFFLLATVAAFWAFGPYGMIVPALAFVLIMA